MAQSNVFYTLEKHKIERSGLMTAAVMSCQLCGNTISGMGGGRSVICETCAQLIISGQASLQNRQK